MSKTPRSTTTRDHHRATIKRQRPPCHICSGDIDYTLPHTDPMSYVVDHIIPLAKGGTDELENKAAAHRHCNRIKSDKLEDNHQPVGHITDRCWW